MSLLSNNSLRLLGNTLKHAENHNKMVETQRMWNEKKFDNTFKKTPKVDRKLAEQSKKLRKLNSEKKQLIQHCKKAILSQDVVLGSDFKHFSNKNGDSLSSSPSPPSVVKLKKQKNKKKNKKSKKKKES